MLVWGYLVLKHVLIVFDGFMRVLLPRSQGEDDGVVRLGVLDEALFFEVAEEPNGLLALVGLQRKNNLQQRRAGSCKR